jgi:quercetin dioxygenase-like cupin family protein
MKRLIPGMIILIMMTSTPLQADDIVVEELIRSTSSWDGEPLPIYPEGQPEITILKFTIPAGAKLASHTHSVINAGVLLSGTLTVVSEDQEELHLKPGDALIELVDKLHHGQNDGTEPAVILVFYAGIKGEEFTHLAHGDDQH